MSDTESGKAAEIVVELRYVPPGFNTIVVRRMLRAAALIESLQSQLKERSASAVAAEFRRRAAIVRGGDSFHSGSLAGTSVYNVLIYAARTVEGMIEADKELLQTEAPVSQLKAQRGDATSMLLRQARDFVGKSRCSMGHSTSEVKDRANPTAANHCLYCEHQLSLYRLLESAASPVAQRGAQETPRATPVAWMRRRVTPSGAKFAWSEGALCPGDDWEPMYGNSGEPKDPGALEWRGHEASASPAAQREAGE
jgi:hypothetical protein